MKNPRIIGVIGLGYVGLPIAVSLSKHFKVIGFDIDSRRVDNLSKGVDDTNELSISNKKELKKVKLTNNKNDLKKVNFFIITVPTPIYKNKKPDLRNLISASETVSKYLKKNDVIVYESTTYPGCTDNICIPILEKISKLKINKDFYCGYSPERINPGDKKHTLNKIAKIISGSNSTATQKIFQVYKNIISKKLVKVKSIKIAEASKIIENIQRDINIALMNELSKIFNKLKIDFSEVLKASKTKWNFLNFSPGLVGGHCIGVDPYYLADLAKNNKIDSKIILSGRKINDEMHNYISNKIHKSLKKNKKKSKIILFGLTFKENIPDFRNSQSIEIIEDLKKYNYQIDTFDPFVEKKFKGVSKHFVNFNNIKNNDYDLVIIAVSHKIFIEKGLLFFKKILNKNGKFFDLKNIFNNEADFKL